jgi:hypothetical protein
VHVVEKDFFLLDLEKEKEKERVMLSVLKTGIIVCL